MADEKEYTITDFVEYDTRTKLLTDKSGNLWWPIEWLDHNGESIGINRANQDNWTDALYMYWNDDDEYGNIQYYAARRDLVTLAPTEG